MSDPVWDYSGVPVTTFQWEIPAAGEQAFTYARVNAGGIRWTGETTNPIYGGGYSIGTQRFDEFLASGPPAGAALSVEQVAPLREYIERHRRAVAGPVVVAPDAVDAEGYTALHRAATAGDVTEIARLIAAGAHVSVRTTDSATTPLHLACERLRAGAVDALIAAGADVAARDAFDVAPLERAIEAFTVGDDAPREVVVRALLAAGAPASVAALVLAAGRGYARIVAELLAHGADARAVNRNGDTALLAGAHDPKVVRVLLAAGADPRVVNRGRTALHAAVDGASVESVALLVEAGADPEAPDQMGVTPLARARALRRADLEQALQRAR